MVEGKTREDEIVQLTQFKRKMHRLRRHQHFGFGVRELTTFMPVNPSLLKAGSICFLNLSAFGLVMYPVTGHLLPSGWVTSILYLAAPVGLR